MNADSPPAVPTRRPTGPTGPDPGMLASVSLGLLIASLSVGVILTGQTFPSPLSPTVQVAGFFRENSEATGLASMLQFGSAVPLGIYAATVYARLLRLGVRVPGPGIGFFGGISASILLLLSASVMWVLSFPEITVDATLTHALSLLAFILGGVGYVTGIGLLIAGISVPGLLLGLVPRWIAWTGLLIAVLSELSFLSMTIEPFQYLLPIGRFAGLLWLTAVGFLLPRNRAAKRQEARR